MSGRYERPRVTILFVALALIVACGAVAQRSRDAVRVGGPSAQALTLTWVPGSTVKVEQITGDIDWADCAKGIITPTTSQTVTRFNVMGNGLGYSFEDNGKMIFLFGDTIGLNVDYHGQDAFGWSTSTDPNQGLLLNIYTKPDGSPLFVRPPGIKMGPDDVPNCGITLPTGVYIVCNTGSDVTQANPHAADYSVLATFDESTQTFTAGRTISKMDPNLPVTSLLQGHFIINSLHTYGTDVLMYGLGAYRATDVYLADIPASSFDSGTGTRYFTGLSNGQPTWSNQESDAVPVVQDNPSNGPAWPNDNPTIGNVSVAYATDLGLWIMTFDGGRQNPKTTGIYFCYSTSPWGPWSTPQLIFNSARDNGLGVFIHDSSIVPDPPGDGLAGPTIGSNDIYTTHGGEFAPQMIERFTRVSGSTLTIHFTLSTWNPYTVVRMKAQFAVSGQ